MSTFASLSLHPTLVKTIHQRHTHPTPIQIQSIPPSIAGRDIVASAPTGTGKTLAYLLPIVHKLLEIPCNSTPKALILAPTRELAQQIHDHCSFLCTANNIHSIVLYGGVDITEQIAQLQQNPNIIIATLGRLLDLHNQGYVDLSNIHIFVLDEVDRMMDLGFAPDLERLQYLLPTQRQNIAFSATISSGTQTLLRKFVHNPLRIDTTSNHRAQPSIKQHVLYVETTKKLAVLQSLLSNNQTHIVFVHTKQDTDLVATFLAKHGVACAALHSDKSQLERQRILDSVQNKTILTLVATDVASRGLDITHVDTVINFDIPSVPANYVHRIGRTGRGAKEGTAIALVTQKDIPNLLGIEKHVGHTLTDIKDSPWRHYPTFEKAMVARVVAEEEAERKNKKSQKHRTSKRRR